MPKFTFGYHTHFSHAEWMNVVLAAKFHILRIGSAANLFRFL